MENRLKTLEEQMKTIITQMRILNDEIMRVEGKVDSTSVLDEKVTVMNGREHKITVREILIDTYSMLEPIRLFYLIKNFLSRYKFLKYCLYIANVLFAISLMGFTLTGKGLLEIIGILK